MRFSVDKWAEFCITFFMENSSSPISFPPLFSFLSLPSKTQGLSPWTLSLIDALSKGYEDFKLENQALKTENAVLKEELDGAKKLLDQKDKIIDSLTRRNQELENRLNTNSTNSNRPPSTDPPFVDRSKPSSQNDSKPSTSETADNSENHAKPKKRPYHRGAAQKPMTPTEERQCVPQVCPHCGGTHFDDLTECSHFQYIELPVVCLIVILFRSSFDILEEQPP